MKGWFMRLFGAAPPERTTADTTAVRDPGYYLAQEAYQREKQAAMAKQIEQLARLNRLGYDAKIATHRRTQDDDAF